MIDLDCHGRIFSKARRWSKEGTNWSSLEDPPLRWRDRRLPGCIRFVWGQASSNWTCGPLEAPFGRVRSVFSAKCGCELSAGSPWKSVLRPALGFRSAHARRKVAMTQYSLTPHFSSSAGKLSPSVRRWRTSRSNNPDKSHFIHLLGAIKDSTPRY